MAFSEALAERIRRALTDEVGLTEMKMFGGLGFMLHGNMLVGVWKESLIVRLGLEQADLALMEPHVKAFDITGRPMKGWLLVSPEGLEVEDSLQNWIDRAIDFVKTLPAK